MSSIDERIVDMKFNNAQFERGIAESNKSLEKLKQNLTLDGAKRGLNDLASAGKNFTLSTIEQGVQGVSAGFVALATIGVTALAGIASQAIATGGQLVSSLTVAPIMQGFGEYETKMGSIQTILANTAKHGTGLSDVVGALDELNEYADKTIYNFADMTRNIGLFTNAGIGVEDATSMIQGFSNEAAASGTNAQGAAGAAYQLSQALSAGTIRLMDWRSLQNVGMGNKNMQIGLIELATAMGTFSNGTATAQSATANFNGSLEQNWLTADVMSAYLRIMAGDMDAAQMATMGLSEAQIQMFQEQQVRGEEAATKVRTWTQLIGTLREAVGSSWAETFDLLLGDFDEATELFTSVNNTLGAMIGAAGDARNDLISGWDALGGREELITAIGNAFQFLMDVIEPIGDAFRKIFPPKTAQDLFNLTHGILEFTESLNVSGVTGTKIQKTFEGLFAIFDIAGMLIGEVASTLLDLFGVATQDAGGILDLTANVGDFIVGVRDAIKEGEIFTKIFGTIGGAVETCIEWIRIAIGTVVDFGESLLNVSSGGFDGFFDRLAQRFAPLAGIGEELRDIWGGLGDWIASAWDAMQPIFAAIGEGLANFGDLILQGLQGADWNTVFDGINTGLFAGLLLMLRGVFSGGEGGGGGILSMLFGDGFGDTVEGFNGVLEGVTGALTSFQDQIKAKVITQIAIALAILAGSLLLLSLIDSSKLTSSIGAITVLFAELMGTLYMFQNATTIVGTSEIVALAAALIMVSIALAILSGAVVSMAQLSWDELARGLAGTLGLIGALALMSKTLSKDVPNLFAAGAALAVVGIAVRILASAVASIAELNPEALTQGLLGVGALLGGLALFTKFAVVNKGAVAQAVGLILLGAALKILASALKDVGSMSPEAILGGLVGIGSALAMISSFSTTIAKPQALLTMAISMLALGAAMKIFAQAISSFAQQSYEDLARGMVGLAGSLAIVSGAIRAMPMRMAEKALSLIAVGYALKLVAESVGQMGGMSWDEIGRGLTVLAGSLAILAVAMNVMNGAIAGAAALLVVAFALSVFVPVLQSLGNMSWEQIGTGLGALAIALGILAVAGLVMGAAIPVLLGLGIAVALLGAGAMMAGAAVLAFGLGLAALASIGAVGAAGLTAVLTAVISLLPYFFEQLGLAIIAFAQVISEGGPAIVEALVTVLMSMIEAIGTVAPEIVTTLLDILLLFIESIVTLIPPLIEATTTLILALIDAIVVLVPEIINAATVIVMAFVEGIVTLIPYLVDAGLRLLTGVINGIANNIGQIITAGTNLVVNFLNGIGSNIPRIIQAGVNLILNFVNGLANGIRNNQGRMRDAGLNLANAVVNGMTGGLLDSVGRVANQAASLARQALDAARAALGINSPSKEFYEIGIFSGSGFSLGMEKMEKPVAQSAETLGNSALDSMRNSLVGLSDILQSDIDMTPTIAPVLDLTAVRNEAKSISGILGADAFSAGVSYHMTEVIQKEEELYRANQENPTAKDKESANVVFNQYNNSPKALSSKEIYRQTKNQISQIKDSLEL